jgi:putative ABC transport system ATP-binding protein
MRRRGLRTARGLRSRRARSALAGRGDGDGDPLYLLEKVSRVYGDVAPVHALRECDLVIHRGEYVAISGKSGSGKSTLLNLLGLIDVPTSGRITMAGHDLASMGQRARTDLRGRSIGFVFQAFHLLPHRTLLDNVCLPSVYQPVRTRDARRRAEEALVRVGLGDRLDSRPSELSGGQSQRVAIARAVAQAPEILLCDEPSGNLDRENTEQVVTLLEELNEGGLTVLIVTHDEEVARRARRLVTVSDGRVSGRMP